MDGFSLFRKDRKDDPHGGVCAYVSSNLCVAEVTNETLNSNEVEQVWFSIKVGTENVLTGCIYRPPVSDLATKHAISTNNVIKSINEANTVKNQDIAKELCLPPVKLHCSSKIK